MKRSFLYALAVIVAAIGMTSCEGGGSGKVHNIEFKRMHLDGVKALALASDGSDEQEAPRRVHTAEGDGEITYETHQPVYSVSEDGTLVEITYTIEARGNGEVVDMVKAKMRLVMENIFTIGDEWLWLYNCYYDFPDLEDLKEPYYSMIKEIVDNFYGNFLVRKRDGALFYWDGRDGRPLYTNQGVPFYQQSDLNSVVECIKGEIYSNCWQQSHLAAPGLYRLKDQGDQLAVTRMHNETLFSTSITPDDRGIIGLDIFYEGTNGSSPGILFVNNLSITSIEVRENNPVLPSGQNLNWAFISVNNTLYAVTDFDSEEGWFTYFYTVDIDEAQSRVFAGELVAKSQAKPDLSTFGVCRVSHKETFSWLNNGYKHTFDPQAKKVTSTALPEHYPSDYTEYYNDVAYVMGSGERAFYICDMAKDRAEEVTIDWSEFDAFKSKLAQSTIKAFDAYNPRTQSFVKTALTLDGQKVTIMVDVAGDNKGKARVYKAGDTTAGQVISVMVRLN